MLPLAQIPGTGSPTLGDFLAYFPLPSEDFHFRFKFDDKAYGYSWMVCMIPHQCANIPHRNKYICY